MQAFSLRVDKTHYTHNQLQMIISANVNENKDRGLQVSAHWDKNIDIKTYKL